MKVEYINSEWKVITLEAPIIRIDLYGNIVLEREYRDGWTREIIEVADIMDTPIITGQPCQKVYSFS